MGKHTACCRIICTVRGLYMPAVLFSGCRRHETVATLVVGALLRFFFKRKQKRLQCHVQKVQMHLKIDLSELSNEE